MSIIVDESEVVAPLGEADVVVLVCEVELDLLGSLYASQGVCALTVCVKVLNYSRMSQ
jgi:hypothetical protein